MTKLRVSPELALPVETVTQAIGIVAKRRVGKSYTARRIAEQLLHAGQQVVIVDPKGDWWGIRSSQDGESPGFPVVILGGEHKDVPIGVDSGEIVAKLVVEERVSVLIDLSEFRKREVKLFMADFLETLYRLKAKESLRTPVMVIIDEADAIAPQKPGDGEERMLGAAEDIVRRGGQRGIGCMMITQRTAVLNKNVLTQCEMLVALRTISPQDLKAMQAWIDVHGEEEDRKTLMASLPSLPQGDAWFWSPGWPTSEGIYKRVHVLPIETFDSGATPKAGEKRVEPKSMADIDLDALTRQMAATIERAKADDPKELRKEIAALKKQLAVAPAKTVEKTVVDRDEVQRLAMKAFGVMASAKAKEDAAAVRAGRSAIALLEKSAQAIVTDVVPGLRQMLAALTEARPETFAPKPTNGNGHHAESLSSVSTSAQSGPLRREPSRQPRVMPRHAQPSVAGGEAGGTSLKKGERITLTAIAQYPDGADREQLTVLTGYKRSSRDTYIQRLQAAGLVDVRGGLIFATDAGIDALGPDFEPLPTGEALRVYWLDRLGGGEREILSLLIDAGGDPVSREIISEATPYKRSSRDTYLQRLAARKLVESVGRGEVRASPILFDEAGL